MKRVFALVLCLCMVLAVVPAVSAATGNVSLNGNATYNTVEEALAAAAAGDTVTLNADVTAGQVIVPNDVTLNLNGYALTADMVIVFNGYVQDNVANTGKIIVPQNMIKFIGESNGNLPVWNADEACYTLVSVHYQEMMNVAEDLSYANYIFIPNFDLNTLALLSDGGADNGISVKVLLSWNEGASQQIYTFSDEMVAEVYASANANGVCARVFQLTITGFAGIEDMTACAVVESTAGVQICNDASKVALPEPEEPEVPEEPEEPAIADIVLTVDSLGLTSNSYTAGTQTVDGVDFEWIQLGNYGDGIQVRDKNGNTSTLWNTAAFGKGIKEIKLVYSSTKDITNSNPDAEIFYFGNEAGTYTYETKLSTTSGVKEYTITPDADTYTFFKFEHDLGYTFYWDSITIVFNGEATSEPEAPVDPEPEDPTPEEPEPEDPTPEEPETPEETGTLKAGDKVVIYAPAYNKALSSTKTGNYNVGVDVTVNDGVVTGYGETEIWVVGIDADGNYTFSQNGQNIGMAASYASMNLGAANDTWTLVDLGNGLFAIQNVGRGNYMEWYAKYSNWSTYNSSSYATDNQFHLAFYIIAE